MTNKKSRLFYFLYKRAHRGGILWRFAYWYYTTYILGCDIKYTTKIGEGFLLFHSAHGSVINPHAIIGKNVSLRQNTTIGAKDFNDSTKSPVIGDNVAIGPNVCIIGDIHIGNGAMIGAGAVVVKDVPENAVVAGNPAEIIKYV